MVALLVVEAAEWAVVVAIDVSNCSIRWTPPTDSVAVRVWQALAEVASFGFSPNRLCSWVTRISCAL